MMALSTMAVTCGSMQTFKCICLNTLDKLLYVM